MTETIAGGSKKTIKHTCGECKRTVYVVTLPDGERVFVDPELITVVPFEGSPKKITARRSHKELCYRYQLDNEKAKAKAHAAKLKAKP